MYKVFLSVMFCLGLLSYLGFRETAKNIHPNYLYIDALNLKSHKIEKSSNFQGKKIVFLGSSGVSGSNIPEQSTISDYMNMALPKSITSYNLGVLQGTLTESLIYLKQSIEYKPSVAIIGISPGTVPGYWASVTSFSNLDLIEDDITPSYYNYLKKEKQRKMYLDVHIQKYWQKTPPQENYIKYKSFINNLKYQMYGPLISKDFYGSKQQDITNLISDQNPQINIIDSIMNVCRQNNIKVVFYLEPIFEPYKVYGDAFSEYVNNLKKYISERGIQLFDYTNFIPFKREFFIDYTHLKPLGNKMLAEKLYDDFKGELL